MNVWYLPEISHDIDAAGEGFSFSQTEQIGDSDDSALTVSCQGLS
jgi:hypothetical protein